MPKIMKGTGRAALAGAAFAVSALTATAPTQAAVLLNEDFSAATIFDGLTVTSSSNLNKWVDFPNSNRWGLQTGGICASPCTGQFAQHLVQASDNTNLLFYGISGAGITAGSTLTLDLSYIASNRAGRATIAGLTGSQEVDPFAPWFQPADANDGVVLTTLSLAQSATWKTAHLEITLNQTYNAFVIGFEMGGTTGSRGVDNILFQNIPEPGTLALFGTGLVGAAVARRRKKN